MAEHNHGHPHGHGHGGMKGKIILIAVTALLLIAAVLIEKYCTLQKVEYVKELLFYGELNISEIADLLHYSSTAHLSARFKSVTGLTPSQFRRLKSPGLSPIDGI